MSVAATRARRAGPVLVIVPVTVKTSPSASEPSGGASVTASTSGTTTVTTVAGDVPVTVVSRVTRAVASAVITIAAIGYRMKYGMMDKRKALTSIIGIVVVFGAVLIVDEIRG